MPYHDALDSVADCDLDGPIFEPGLANVDVKMLVELQNATVAVVQSFKSVQQPILVVAEDISQKIGLVYDFVYLKFQNVVLTFNKLVVV